MTDKANIQAKYQVQVSHGPAGSAIPVGWKIEIINGIAYYIKEG